MTPLPKALGKLLQRRCGYGVSVSSEEVYAYLSGTQKVAVATVEVLSNIIDVNVHDELFVSEIN